MRDYKSLAHTKWDCKGCGSHTGHFSPIQIQEGTKIGPGGGEEDLNGQDCA